MLPLQIKQDVLKRYRRVGVLTLHRVSVDVNISRPMSGCSRDGSIKMGAWTCATLVTGPSVYRRTLIHEYAHAIMVDLWPRLSRNDRRHWEAVFGENKPPEGANPLGNLFRHLGGVFMGRGLFDRATYVTLYASSDANEDWAETVTEYILGDKEAFNTPALAEKRRAVKYFLERYRTLSA